MKKRDDGAEPAFPCRSKFQPTGDVDEDGMVRVEEHPVGFPGMTLWDWFAGQAMAGILASAAVDLTYDDLASRAGKQADAMLARRAKDGEDA